MYMMLIAIVCDINLHGFRVEREIKIPITIFC